MSLFHSLWQAGFLLCLFAIAEKILQTRFSPLQKKNLLFVLLTIQAILFLITFIFYFFTFNAGNISILFSLDSLQYFPSEKINQLTPWLFFTYLVIIGYKLISTVYNWHFLKKQFSAGIKKPTIELKLFTATQQLHFGIKRKVKLWFSTTIDTPITFGFFKPVILLPVALVNKLSLQQAETLILHELTHIKANDYLLNWFLMTMETIFFFNPFICLLSKKIKLEREKNCDVTVTAFAYSPLLYAETLLQAQMVKQYTPQYQLAAVGKKNQLLNRIRFFTNPQNQLKSTQKNPFWVLLLFFILFSSAAVFLQFCAIVKNKTTITVASEKNKAVNEIAEMPVFANTVLENFTGENLNKMASAVEMQKPLIEKKIKQLEPLLKQIERKARDISKAMEENFATPATIMENDAARQIIIKEEHSGSKNTTLKIYTLLFKDGKWQLQPQWKLTAKEVLPEDSTDLIDSSDLTNKNAEQ